MSVDNCSIPSVPPLLVFGLALLVGIVANWLWPTGRLLEGPPGVAVGSLLAFGALVLNTWCAYEFGKRRTHFDPHRATAHLVNSGPYRFSRNPMYLGLSLLMTGIGLVAGNGWILLMVAPAVIVLRYLVVLPEERALLEIFGEEYTSYCERVGRWFTFTRVFHPLDDSVDQGPP